MRHYQESPTKCSRCGEQVVLSPHNNWVHRYGIKHGHRVDPVSRVPCSCCTSIQTCERIREEDMLDKVCYDCEPNV